MLAMRSRGKSLRTIPLVFSLVLLGAVLVGHGATLAGTPVIPGCPCVFLGMGAADGVRAIGLETLSAGALLALSAAAAAMLALILAGMLLSLRARATARFDEIRSGAMIASLLPLRATVTVLSRKMRFRRASSTSFSGVTHSAV
jgi:hypothetical protein